MNLSEVFSCFRIGFIGTAVKGLMIIANILLSFSGLIFLGMGLAFLLVEETILSWLPWKVTLFAVPFISTGLLIYVITIFGCCGAWKESRTFLALYSIIMTALVVAEVYLLIMSWGKLDQVESLTVPWVYKAFNKPEMREPFHLLEVSMQCCGADGAKSYEALKVKLPPSCCKEPVPIKNSSLLTCNSGDAFDGCVEVVPPYLQKLAGYASSNIYYVIGVEVLAVIASSYLFRAISPS